MRRSFWKHFCVWKSWIFLNYRRHPGFTSNSHIYASLSFPSLSHFPVQYQLWLGRNTQCSFWHLALVFFPISYNWIIKYLNCKIWSWSHVVSSGEVVSSIEFDSSIEVAYSVEADSSGDVVSSGEVVSSCEVVSSGDCVSSCEVVSSGEGVSSCEVVSSGEVISSVEVVSSSEVVPSGKVIFSGNVVSFCEVISSGEVAYSGKVISSIFIQTFGISFLSYFIWILKYWPRRLTCAMRACVRHA